MGGVYHNVAGYLITGGAGFIGSHLARRLVERGESVRIFDNFSSGKRENLADIESAVEVVEADLRDLDAVMEATRGVDYILHQAALASVPRSIADPVSTNAVNVGGTLHVLMAAKEHCVKRIVFASSSSVYGDQDPAAAKREDMRPNPLSPYAVSKHVGEQYGHVFHKLHDLPFVAIRYFNVFGPYQDEDSDYAAVIPIFSRCLLTGKRPTVFGDGKHTRDFTYISNVVDANMLAMEREEAIGHTINVACNGSFDLNYLIQRLNLAYGTDLEPIYAEPRAGDVKHSLADISRARELLGYDPAVGFEDGLEESARWYEKKLAATQSP